MLLKQLFEAPIGQYDVIPTVSHERGKYGAGSFRSNEIAAAKNPKWIEKVHNFFKNCPYLFNIYIYDGPEKYRKLEHKRGYYTGENIRQFFGITPPNSSKSINIVMTNNDGADRFPLTPWILCHRVVHSFFDGENSVTSFNPMEEVKNRYLTMGNNFLSYLSKYAIDLAVEEKSGVSLDDSFNNLVAKICNFRSAKNKLIIRKGELFIELFVQYILEGKVTFNKLYDYSEIENDPLYKLYKQYDYKINFITTCLKKHKMKGVPSVSDPKYQTYQKLFKKYSDIWDKFQAISNSKEFNFQDFLNLYEKRFNDSIKDVLDLAVGKYFLL
jgi:hypothetical protein